MADTVTYEQVAALAARLSPEDRLRLAQELDQSVERPAKGPPAQWADVAGSVPHPLCGEDAQAWVSRSRREDDERAEADLRRAWGED
jgi:hypothetical protein